MQLQLHVCAINLTAHLWQQDKLNKTARKVIPGAQQATNVFKEKRHEAPAPQAVGAFLLFFIRQLHDFSKKLCNFAPENK
jgi:hypothetical protein